MNANKVKQNSKMSCFRGMTAEPAAVEESFEIHTLDHCRYSRVFACIRVHSRFKHPSSSAHFICH